MGWYKDNRKYICKKIVWNQRALWKYVMVLDTIIPLQSAINLYKKVGFVECEAYYHNPMDNVFYFKKII